MIRTGWALLAAIVTATLAAGCGGQPDKPAEPVVDLSQLDVGNLPTKPRDLGVAKNLDQARLVQAMRLGNYVPLPVEIDPAVKYAGSPVNGIVRIFQSLESGAIVQRMDAKPDQFTTAETGLVGGFVSTGLSDQVPNLSYELDNVVMLYADEQSAAAAATAMEQADFQAMAGAEPVQIGKYPPAHAHHAPGIPGLIRSWYAAGRFVIFTYIFDNVMSILHEQRLPQLVDRVEKSIDAITPRVRQFPVTPTDQLLNTPIDLDGMLGRTLSTVTVDRSQRGIPGVYDRHGGLQIVLRPDLDIDQFEQAGVDRVAFAGGFVFRARDTEAAEKLADQHAILGKRYKTAPSPKGLPIARCRELKDPQSMYMRFMCVVRSGRYVAELAADQLTDVQQRISAQYAILANGG
ncbi:DUF7373 family lipoprotein [Nocardia arthritidis]|uniref:Uncharacterized protein n=1 Tax=Nocardia arthritidis TaxID=228602 RepID=A0A6G9Y780_9NOCA|nr:hypothetical protein [Nocardia arthritidis]QIS09059.1 hypothetical protein F5544_05735 [Nocardia arthritidis]